jgi:serine protease Do
MVSRREFYGSLFCVALVAGFLGVLWGRGQPRTVPAFGIRAAEAKLLASSPFSFASVASRAMPAVVNIFTTQRVRVQLFPSPFGRDPFLEQFFPELFPQVPLEREQRSLGSGVIFDRHGYIVTNHHVVANADVIKVKLADAREFPAKLVGSDPRTDVALIHVDAEDLPQAEFGDSDELGVGDWVLAIGNPFGLEQTVTAGIVSAKERVIGAGPFDDFIQTDASINPGNSGGPLVDMNGQVVGINTAIFSRSGGSIGIGFAIPINLVKQVAHQLKASRRVIRGWLGVAMQDVTPALARALGLPRAEGVVVAEIYPGGPAHAAGMRRGDVIVGYEGRRVRNSHDLALWVAETPVGRTVEIEVLRDGRERTFAARILEPPA